MSKFELTLPTRESPELQESPEMPESHESPESPESPKPPHRIMPRGVLQQKDRQFRAIDPPQPQLGPQLGPQLQFPQSPELPLRFNPPQPIRKYKYKELMPVKPPESSVPPEPPLKLPPPLDSPWKIPIIEKLEQGRQYKAAFYPWKELSIYRVPKPFRDVDERAYTPQIVAIGPYHRDQSHLCDMERHKWRALDCALQRKGDDLSRYLEACHSLQFRARACYEASLSISTDELVESLLIDAIFVLELFRGVYDEGGFPGLGYDPNDPVFTCPGIISLLMHDMLMLENQLPFFILERIIALQLENSPEVGNSSDLLARLALNFFRIFMPMHRPSNEFFDSLKYAGKAVHCLDFFRLNLLLEGPKNQRTEPVDGVLHFNHSVTELRAAGFGFRPVESAQFWDIKFKNGVLHIPRLHVVDSTKSLFLNLIAFEQCHLKPDKHVITTYVVFIDKLINSEEDVRYLHHKRIMETFLGNYGEVADLFNLLCKNVPFNIEECYLSELFKQMNIYYDHRWNSWRAILVEKYFSNPWAIISLVAAIILLLLTFMQTFYSIYGYYKPN